MLNSIKSKIDQVLRVVLIVLMALLLLDVVWQVFSRYVLSDPSSFTDELARYLLIWVAFLGAAFLTGKRLHIAIDMLSKKLGISQIDRLVGLVTAIFALTVMVIGGSRLVAIILDLNQLSPSLRVPIGYVYLALPISGLLIVFYSVVQIIHPKMTED